MLARDYASARGQIRKKRLGRMKDLNALSIKAIYNLSGKHANAYDIWSLVKYRTEQ